MCMGVGIGHETRKRTTGMERKDFEEVEKCSGAHVR